MRADDLLEEPRFFSSFSCVPRVTQREFSSFLFFVSLPFSFPFFGSFFVPRCICDTVYDLNSFYVFCFFFCFLFASVLSLRFGSVPFLSLRFRRAAAPRDVRSARYQVYSYAAVLTLMLSSGVERCCNSFTGITREDTPFFFKYIFTTLLCVCVYTYITMITI